MDTYIKSWLFAVIVVYYMKIGYGVLYVVKREID
jgi:hypothetical protein